MSEEFALDNVGNFDEIEAFPPEFDDSYEEKKQESVPNYETENVGNQFVESEVQQETGSNFEAEQEENQYQTTSTLV